MLRAAALVLFLALPASGRAQSTPDFSAVTALLQDSLAQFGGGEFLLRQHGETLYRASFAGWDSTAAVPIASASKWLSGTLVMSLVADGTLSLDDTVGDWLPDAPPNKRAITVRQLFAHTSGLPPLDVGGCLDDRTTTLAACAQAILDGPLRSPPGQAFRYGGLSMQVAGRIAEVAAGEPFGALFEARVAEPLGLTRTGFGAGDNPRVAGGAASTAGDYARVLQMLADGGATVLAPTAVDTMLADQTRGAEIVYSPYQQYGDPDLVATRYGVGVWRERVADDGTLLEAASQGALGFSPWLDRANGIVAVLAVQDDLPALYPTYLRLKALVRDALGVQTASEGAPPAGRRLAAWPNPARHRLTVEMPLDAGTACLTDAVGRRVRCANVPPSGRLTFDVGTLAPGAYAVRATGGGQEASARVVVVR